MSTLDDLLARMKQLHPLMIDLSLERVERLLAELGSPHECLPAVVHLADELLQHLLGDGEVGDDAVLHRADHGDLPWRLAKHVLGARADGLDRFFGVRPAFHADRDDRRLVEDDALAALVNQRIGRAEVDREVIGKITAQKTKHSEISVKAPLRARGVRHL